VIERERARERERERKKGREEREGEIASPTISSQRSKIATPLDSNIM